MEIMRAIVIEVQWQRLLVLDLDARQQVLVNTPDARYFAPGDFVRIWFSGAMTRSIPPQITAIRIVPMQPPQGFRPPVILPPIVVPLPPRRPPVRPRPPMGRPPMGRPPMGNRPGRPPRRRDD